MTPTLRQFVTHSMGILFGYVVIQALVSGYSYLPLEADSLYYHIPLAHQYLTGSFLAADFGNNIHMYFPAATEVLLAMLLSIGLPIGWFNVFGLLALWSGCYFLGRASKLKSTQSLLFACTIGTLYGVVRWVHAQTVDIWLAAYYVTALGLLLKPGKQWWYFLNLGIMVGMLVGSKYSGPLFAVGLYMINGRSWWSELRHQVTQASELLVKLGIAGLTTALVGGFWYLRNWLVTANPVFPLDTPFFKGIADNGIISTQIWKAYLLYPRQMIDGAVSEFMIWPVVVICFLAYVLYSLWQKKLHLHKSHTADLSRTALTFTVNWNTVMMKLLMLGVYNFGVFLFLPSGQSMQLHTSQYRLGYVVIIVLILACFKFTQQTKKFDQLLDLAVLTNVLVITSFLYRPKIMIGLVILYLIIRYFYSCISAWQLPRTQG